MPSTKKTTAKTGKARSQTNDLPGAQDIGDDEDDAFATVLYGRSGSGKTTLSSTWPGRKLLLDIRDRGTRSVRDVKDMQKRRIESIEDLDDAYWWLVDNPTAYDTVIVDTVSQLQTLAVKEHAAGKGKKSSRAAGDWGSMTKRDWGDVAALMKEKLINYRDLIDLGIDVVFIAQDRAFNFDTDEDEEQNEMAPEIGPQLSPSIAKSLNASVDFIGNTFIRSRWVKVGKAEKGKKQHEEEQIDFCLRIGPNSMYVTKSRKPKFQVPPAVIVDPSYDDLMAIIEGDYK